MFARSQPKPNTPPIDLAVLLKPELIPGYDKVAYSSRKGVSGLTVLDLKPHHRRLFERNHLAGVSRHHTGNALCTYYYNEKTGNCYSGARIATLGREHLVSVGLL